VRVTWIGHSTVAIELDGVCLLTDPLLRPRVTHLTRARTAPLVAPPRPDVVLVSHVHYDHFDLPSLRRLDRSTRVVLPRGAGRMVRRRGFSQVVELLEGEETQAGEVTVRATRAVHSARRVFGQEVPALGFVIDGSTRTFFVGDTDLFDGMRDLASELDLALLPVAGWGPRVPEGHLDPQRAAEALAMLRPRVAVPIHWGTFRRIGLHLPAAELRKPAEEFAELAATLAPETEVRILEPGASTEVAVREEARA
jgi:L-ascorbate metabolism protein UlaG (beta-lactamase superfamily)